MKSGNSRDRCRCARVSRRQLLGGAGVAYRSLVVGKCGATSDENLAPPRFLLKWGRPGKAEGEFAACVGIAIDKNDQVYLYVTDTMNGRIQKFEVA